MNEIEWNSVKYIDCMDPDQGLPSLPDNSIDLCITDPPYNANFKMKLKRLAYKTIPYNDKIENYDDWCKTWYFELKRICKLIVLTPGNQNLRMWYLIDNPREQLIHYKKNCCGSTYLSHNTQYEPILVFGKYWDWSFGKKPFKLNVFEILRETSNYIHPCPKSYQLWYQIISGLNPTSVIDPFLGSGTTAEVCTKLGIPWIGYEIIPEYSQDIEKRLKNCIIEPKQITLEHY